MNKYDWQIQLKPILIEKIKEAINEANDKLEINKKYGTFPWIGDNCYQIMADAAICVLRGMQDHQDFVENEVNAA